MAVCDEDIVGKKFKDGKLCFNVSESFYKGKKVTEAELKELMKCASNINIVGKKSVKIAIDLGLVNESEVISIEGIPHAQVIVL